MASAEAEALKAGLREMREQVLGGDGPPPSLEESREGYALFAALTGEPEGVTHTDVDAGGVPAVWAEPAVGATDRVLQYVHGGGYVLGAARYYLNLTGHLANSVGCRVLNVDYRLAPEHPHPAPLTDSVTAYRWLLDQGIEPGHIAIAGDSAGGGLTVATLLKIRDEGLPLPAAGVPLSPWIDMEGTGDSIQSRASVDLIVDDTTLKGMADLFLAGQDPRDPYAAPLHADLAGLPPLYIQVGDEETLLDDATRLAANAAAAGVDVRIDVFDEMQHVFQMGAGNMPEADEALARIGEWLRPRLGL